MANALYSKFKESMLKAGYDLTSVAIKGMLLTTSYTPNVASDQFVGNGTSPIPSGAIVERSGNLSSVTVVLGVFNAATLTFSSVAGGSTVSYLVLYVDTGSDSTSALILIIDTATGLALTTNGGDVTVTWDPGTNKIFKL
jgi:hypothetical protein